MYVSVRCYNLTVFNYIFTYTTALYISKISKIKAKGHNDHKLGIVNYCHCQYNIEHTCIYKYWLN